MAGKKVVESKTETTKRTTTEPDGTVVEVITTTITEKYSDGSSGIRTETQTIRKAPAGANGSDKGPGHAQVLNPDLTPSNSKSPKVENTTDPRFIQECLEAHNKLRSKHGAPALTLDSDVNWLAKSKLAKISQAWCNELAKKGQMQHNNTGFGENIYWNTEKPPPSRAPEPWHSEIKDYNWSKLEMQKGTGHFTQLIWKSTKSVGIALQEGKNGYYVVANYFPPGNIAGKFPDNIQK